MRSTSGRPKRFLSTAATLNHCLCASQTKMTAAWPSFSCRDKQLFQGARGLHALGEHARYPRSAMLAGAFADFVLADRVPGTSNDRLLASGADRVPAVAEDVPLVDILQSHAHGERARAVQCLGRCRRLVVQLEVRMESREM